MTTHETTERRSDEPASESVLIPADAELLRTDELLSDSVGRLVDRLLADGKLDVYRDVMLLVDRHVLRAVMDHCRGNQVHAARCLGISRMTLRTKLRTLGMR